MDLFTEKRILTVSQLTGLITGVLEENFDHVWVEGEVSNLATPSSGHLYFTLKDSAAQIRIVMFKGAARMLRFKIVDGMQLIVRGRVTVFAQRGEYQLVGEYLEPKGIGALQLAFIQLKERLAREGLFSETRKKAIPRLPQRVGIVTSPTGAAIHDILTVLERRFSNIHVLLLPVKVQGEGAAGEIAAAITDFNRHSDVDVLIVGRGGGSLEDLWAFNEEVVARSIAASKIPVISAVGHEIDFTIADLAADLRAPTPSAAAELVIASKAELMESLNTLVFRLNRSMAALMREKRNRFDRLQGGVKEPASLLGSLLLRVDYLTERLTDAIDAVCDRRERQLQMIGARLQVCAPHLRAEQFREQLRNLGARQERAMESLMARLHESVVLRATMLHKLSPLGTLARGYALASRSADGALISSSSQISRGDRVDLRFAQGGARCTVDESLP